MEKIKCEKCGSEMQEFETQASMGMKCPKCGWGWATTNTNSIFYDETEYDLKISPISSPSKEEISIISTILNTNYLTSIKLIKTGNVHITGKASEIIDKIKKLKAKNISFDITPKFPYLN